MICRKNLELITSLYNNVLYVKSDREITVTLDQTTNHISAAKWRQYVIFQADYKQRIGVLRREKREVPKQSGGDKIMPPILQTWQGDCKAAQPQKNFHKNLSCAFNADQINKYEELNRNFMAISKQAAPAAAAKIIPLMLMDIAYLKSCDVEWEGNAAALETEGAREDDDEDEIDTSSWDPLEPDKVPYKDLKIPPKGKLPTPVLYAAVMLGAWRSRPSDVTAWIKRVHKRWDELRDGVSFQDMDDLLTRPFTEAESEIYEQCLQSKNGTAGAFAEAVAATATKATSPSKLLRAAASTRAAA